ncbi:MAG: alanine racemase [Bdellovibrionota bacterium]
MYTWIEIRKSALLNNYHIFCKMLGRKRVLPVLKSNAYGHGLREVAQLLTEDGCDQFGVNYLYEAEHLRSLGFSGRIIILGPIAQADLIATFKLKAEVFVGSESVLQAWKAMGSRPKAHIKFDTGMSRQGFLVSKAESLANDLLSYANDVVGLCTHLADVEDVLEHEYAYEQIANFKQVVHQFKKLNFRLESHVASSASSLLIEESRFDLSRIGISMYGFWPSKATRLSYLKDHTQLANLQPVLNWRCSIANIKTVRSGQYIGYGCAFRAVKDMKIAVLPVGYFEGYSRIAGEHSSHVLVKGRRSPVVGRICMNMMMIDVSHIDDLTIDDSVTLIGMDGDECLRAEDLADWMQTIHYEVVTNLNSCIPRRVIE